MFNYQNQKRNNFDYIESIDSINIEFQKCFFVRDRKFNSLRSLVQVQIENIESLYSCNIVDILRKFFRKFD